MMRRSIYAGAGVLALVIVLVIWHSLTRSLPEVLSLALDGYLPAQVRVEYDCGFETAELAAGIAFVLSNAEAEQLPKERYSWIVDSLLECGLEPIRYAWGSNPLDAALIASDESTARRLFALGVKPSETLCRVVREGDEAGLPQWAIEILQSRCAATEERAMR